MAFEPADTPLLRIPWPGRSDIYVKDESRCPTGTFKDRLAWRLAQDLTISGADNRLLISTITLGNTLVSLAAAFAHFFPDQDLRPEVFGLFPEDFGKRVIGPDRRGRTVRGDDVLVALAAAGARFIEWPLYEGYLASADIARIARSAGLDFDYHRDVTNGIETAAYAPILAEAWSQGAQSVDAIVVPVGAGVLFDEFVSLVEQRGGHARVLGVTTMNEHSVGDKIYGRFSPYYEALAREGTAHNPLGSRHQVLPIDDDQILRALSLLPADLVAEPSAAAAFAPLSMSDVIAPDETVLVINTGSGISHIRGHVV